jgi:hypothetical protein
MPKVKVGEGRLKQDVIGAECADSEYQGFAAGALLILGRTSIAQRLN